MTIEEIMDILDWFDDSLYDYLAHIMLTKLDAEERIERALPELRRHAQELLNLHRGTATEYPGNAQRVGRGSHSFPIKHTKEEHP